MENEEMMQRVEKHIEERQRMDSLWQNLKCPVCGNEKMKYTSDEYTLMDPANLLNRYKGSKGIVCKPVACEKCGYIILRKIR